MELFSSKTHCLVKLFSSKRSYFHIGIRSEALVPKQLDGEIFDLKHHLREDTFKTKNKNSFESI